MVLERGQLHVEMTTHIYQFSAAALTEVVASPARVMRRQYDICLQFAGDRRPDLFLYGVYVPERIEQHLRRGELAPWVPLLARDLR